MKKKIIVLIICIFLMGIFALGIFTAPTIITGYEMYKSAIDNTNLEDAINQVRDDENYIELDKISDDYLKLVLKSEDKRFYYHFGIDFIAIGRAAYNNLKADSLVQGGSTITQQLAKNLYFSFDKKYERKIAEVFVAIDLEKMVTKDEILELYCNIAYFGEGCYGIKEAANYYYGVDPIELSTEQSYALVYTLKSPNNYNPNVYKPIAVYVLPWTRAIRPKQIKA
ncbi:transglycosylase domain-containing protein [Tissierella pigra]|uniref:peptidoglycan glycosyltransferase n=1 Tax=Tissierella pigra TaxID=2607614 RepID=A0A6N7XF01_9FIRM|nr:biosynthetic peptidoglycan transglycosylase [Tissierella pigra]MBU5425988.1 transglycosylase domain-containing protein [Tissierella pigra]MSU00651.1 glycosyl transferase [Tissierella pigra]